MTFKVHYENKTALLFFATTNFWCQGTFLKGNECISPENVLSEIESSSADEFLKNANGFFNLVFQNSGTLFAAVDCVRSLPLFYSVKNENFYISDSAQWIAETTGRKEFDGLAQMEFKCTGYVTGEDTLIPEIKQIQAGEYIQVSENGGTFEIKKKNYFVFAHTEPAERLPETDYMKQLDSAIDVCIDNLIKFAGGRQIVLPLSGGRDSRLIAMKLAERKYENILCYTYGSENNHESSVSRQVADALGLKWFFIKYDNDIPAFLYDSDTGRGYQRMAHNYVSLPHLQDMFAVYKLKESNIVDADSVFVPGHTGDFISGGHIPSITFMEGLNKNVLVGAVYGKHYSLTCNLPGKSVKNLRNRIQMELNPKDGLLSSVEFADSYEAWDWKNRQAKFIVNSVRVYDFLGFSWWLPFWDRNFLEFWEKVPLKYRFERVLYNGFVDSMSEKHGIPVCKKVRTKTYYAIRKIPFLRSLKKWRDSFFSKFAFYNRSLLEKKKSASFIKDSFTEDMIRNYCKYTNELNGLRIYFFLAGLKESKTCK